MKSYYELDKEKIKKYKEEFKSTPGGRKLEVKKYFIHSFFFAPFIFLILYFLVLLILTARNFQADYAVFISNLGLYAIFLVFAAIVNIVFRIIYCYCFASWLKVKHKIQM
ncbi:MAG: hypothetical protein GX864_04355 [Mollicutes bacterium]|nr:hypothetical protein [Mollicutes bacterium]